MATIRQVPSGYWQAIIRKKGFPDQSKTFPKKQECQAWAAYIESQMNRGLFNDLSAAESMTLEEGLRKYLAEVTPAKNGADVETDRINALLRQPFVKMTFATFRQADAAKFRDELLKNGKAASTVRKELSIISNLFNIANKEWGISCINPVEQISKPKVNNERERRVSELELKYLLQAFDDRSAPAERKNKAVKYATLFALESAARQSEILRLEWSDIDLNNRVATILKSKNGDTRGLPLSTKAIAAILGGESSENVIRLKKGKVFRTTKHGLEQSFRRAVDRARKYYLADLAEDEVPDPKVLVDLHFHDFRHEATTRLADVFEMHELMKVTGHKDSRMLARYYHPKPENLAKKLA